jgi:hypothetical protein
MCVVRQPQEHAAGAAAVCCHCQSINRVSPHVHERRERCFLLDWPAGILQQLKHGCVSLQICRQTGSRKKGIMHTDVCIFRTLMVVLLLFAMLPQTWHQCMVRC